MPAGAAEELRARFLELAPEGFEETEDGVNVELAGYGATAERILAAFPGASVSEVADGWEERWREFHHAIRIGSLWVGPPWETPDEGAIPVVIEPGRAFGTGAHPTTHLCLELLLEQPCGSLLDLGCGSGVLAIAAALLGHSPVLALDIDPVAVEVTAENARTNGVDLVASEADGRTTDLPLTDLVVANIALADVQALAPRLPALAAITSGYLASDRPELAGFARIERRERDGWAADLFGRPTRS